MVAPRLRTPSPAAWSGNVYCHRHALERLREHQPTATYRDALRAWDDGEEISTELAHALVGRTFIVHGSIYRIAPSKRGIFVVAPARSSRGRPWVMVTYLRLGLAQVRVVESWRPDST